MGSLVTLIIYGVIAAAAMGILYGAYEAVGNHFREQVRTEYAPLINKCDDSKRKAAECASEWTTAIAANQTLQADVDKIAAERVACTKSIDDWKALADRAATVAQQNRKTAEGAIAQLRVDRTNSLTKAATAPSANESCEQILGEIDKDSRDLAERRAILFPASAPTAPDKLKVGK